MARKKRVVDSGPKPNDGWTYEGDIQINGRNVSKGTELKITGERGRFRFIQQITTDTGKSWIDVWGGPKGAEGIRSFYLDRVKRVHYKNQTVANLAVEYKQKMKDKKAELAEAEDES